MFKDVRSAVVKAIAIMTGMSEAVIGDEVGLPANQHEFAIRVGMNSDPSLVEKVQAAKATNVGQLISQLKN